MSIWRAALAALLIATAVVPSQAIDLDWVMFQDPILPKPPVEVRFPPGLVDLWLQALDRSERDLQRRTTSAITVAHQKGLTGLEVTIAPLMKLLEQEDQDRVVRLAAARALAQLDAREAAQLLADNLSPGDADMAEIVEPALARWKHRPMAERFLDRLNQRLTLRRMHILAIRGLAELQDVKSLPRLLELAQDGSLPADVRLEAARTLGKLQETGLSAPARLLAGDKSKGALVDCLVAVQMLSRHRGPETERLLLELASDAEPPIQAIALRQLFEINPELIAPLTADLANSEDATVRRWAAETLGAKPTIERIAILGPMLDDPHLQLRQFVSDKLLELSAEDRFHDAVLAEGRQVLSKPAWRGQEQSILLLVSMKDGTIADRLLELLEAERMEVHATAAWGLSKLAVAATAEPIHEIFKTRTEYARAGDDRGDRIYLQVCHLAQALGQLKYAPAEETLLEYVPKGQGLYTQPRAAAIWALGWLHADDPSDEKLVGDLQRRLIDINSMTPEEPQVRTMAAISLGRMNATTTVGSLRSMQGIDRLGSSVGHACTWAIFKLTGEPIPELRPQVFWEEDWFLMPIK
jgi:HEAT repeat protein